MTGQEVEMLHTAEVAPAPAVEPYRPQLMMSPADAKALAEGLRENTRAILIDGDDYGVIPGTGSKPTLLKPGAEKLLQWFGLGHRMEQVEVERDDTGKKTGVTYRCVVTKTMGTAEVVVATCDAYAGRDESKWAKAPWNTILKMAEKRALVGAALQATGSSSLFTQDIEPQEAPNPFLLAAIEYVRAQPPDVVALLKVWMEQEGIPARPAEWQPMQVVRMLVGVGALQSEPPSAAPISAAGAGDGVERGSEPAPSSPQGGAGGGTAAAAGAPPMSDPQRRRLMALCNERGLGDRDARLDFATTHLGRDVGSFGDLSKDDAAALMEALDRAPVAPSLLEGV